MKFELRKGRMQDILPELQMQFDSCVTDPPYGLKFMNKSWDYDVPSVDDFKLILSKLKPGAFMLAFGGSRTFHRMAVNIEDAGFEIRDTIMWIYGSGFPKSVDISKAIDKKLGVERNVVGEKKLWGHNAGSGAGSFSKNQYEGQTGEVKFIPITEPGSELAHEWNGWGTALKPAFEPIIVARKPFKGTIVENIQQHRVGGINIDGCRVPLDGVNNANKEDTRGRFPSNIIHDGSDEVVDLFPNTKSGSVKEGGFKGEYTANVYGKYANNQIDESTVYADQGSAARFFYCAKASKKDREEGLEEFTLDVTTGGRYTSIDNSSLRGETERKNTHPTVKPTELMKWLVRLVTKPDAWCLDPYCGSGSTGKACAREGINFFGIDRDDVRIAEARIQFANSSKKKHKKSTQTEIEYNG